MPSGDGIAIVFFLTLDALIDLFSMDGNVLGRVHTDTHLITFHSENGDSDVVSDHQSFTYSTGQDEHD